MVGNDRIRTQLKLRRRSMIGLGLMEIVLILVVGSILIGVPLVVVGVIVALNSNKPKQD
jgi:hypothetical protein